MSPPKQAAARMRQKKVKASIRTLTYKMRGLHEVECFAPRGHAPRAADKKQKGKSKHMESDLRDESLHRGECPALRGYAPAP